MWRQVTEKEIFDKDIIYCNLIGIQCSEFVTMVDDIGYEYFVLNDTLYKVVKVPGERIGSCEIGYQKVKNVKNY